MRIGLIAPPWLPVPPTRYGGTERVVSTLARALESRGHEVALFTVEESTCPVRKNWLYNESQMEHIGVTSIEHAHVLSAYDALSDWDVVHDHTEPGMFHLSNRTPPQALITNHGPFDKVAISKFRKIAVRTPVLAVSNHQAMTATGIPIAAVIHHGIDLDSIRMGTGTGGFLTHIGRMDPCKGVKEAIVVARKVGVPLKIAAKMQSIEEHEYFDSQVRPLLGGGIEYLGEIDDESKWELLRNSIALLNPISWPEPFGLIMAESLAAGTPVLSTRRGAAPEIIQDGVTGFLAESANGLASKIENVKSIRRIACRKSAEERFSSIRMAEQYEQCYLTHLARLATLGYSKT